MSLVPNGNGDMEMEGNVGPDYLYASIKKGANGTLFIQGTMADMPFEQTIQKF